jgi:hypothetical protein
MSLLDNTSAPTVQQEAITNAEDMLEKLSKFAIFLSLSHSPRL